MRLITLQDKCDNGHMVDECLESASRGNLLIFSQILSLMDSIQDPRARLLRERLERDCEIIGYNPIFIKVLLPLLVVFTRGLLNDYSCETTENAVKMNIMEYESTARASGVRVSGADSYGVN
jgi:hypothetical protein